MPCSCVASCLFQCVSFAARPQQVEKRFRAVKAIRGLRAHALYVDAVNKGLCLPVYEPDPEDIEHFSKRAWETAVQSWRKGIEAGAQTLPTVEKHIPQDQTSSALRALGFFTDRVSVSNKLCLQPLWSDQGVVCPLQHARFFEVKLCESPRIVSSALLRDSPSLEVRGWSARACHRRCRCRVFPQMASRLIPCNSCIAFPVIRKAIV